MRKQIILLLFFITSVQAQQHCGYDFTSYVVLHVHEDGKKENINGLTITLVDSTGNEVVNIGNKYSWKNKDEKLVFTENYRIDAQGNKASEGEKLRWFFPFAKDTYLLSVTNEFPADMMQVKISDPNKVYETVVVQLYAYNMYVLCTTQAQQQAMQFGRRTNKPVDIVIGKIK